MSKSLEALKNRIQTLKVNHKIGNRDIANQEILEIAMFLENHIVKDLESYEKLKQDHDKTLINNGELVVKVADLQKENQELKENEIKINRYNSELIVSTTRLKDENQELKHKLGKVLDSIIHYEYTKERCKREKLEKAIEIIKSNLKFKFYTNPTFWDTPTLYVENYFTPFTQQEYELLKEVLE